MSSIFDLMPASFWPVQPFMPPPDPTQAFPRLSASVPTWTLPAVQAPAALGWPSAPVDPYPYADASASSWDRAMRQALAPQASAMDAPGFHSAFSDQTLADAKRAHDFAMWAFGPPSAPKMAPTAMPSSAPPSLGGTSSKADAGSAAAVLPPTNAPAADDGDPLKQTPVADPQVDLGAAYGNPNIARQGMRARAITAMRPPLPPQSVDLFASIPHGFVHGLANTMSASGQAAQIEMQQPVDVPSGDEGAELLEQHVTGPLHRPQGPAGEVGQTIGEFFGNPLTYLFPARSLGARVLSTITAALGSEAAGQLTRGTRAEPLARIAGAMLGNGVRGVGDAARSRCGRSRCGECCAWRDAAVGSGAAGPGSAG